MLKEITEFLYFLMSVMLLSNTNYLYFALKDIQTNAKDHQVFIFKCLVFTLYTVFLSIIHVFKFLQWGEGTIFVDNAYSLLIIAISLFFVVTAMVYYKVKRSTRLNLLQLDWQIQLTFVLVLANTLGFIDGNTLYTLVFLCYTVVTLKFFYNVVILKKVGMHFGLFFLLASYLVLTICQLLKVYLPFEIFVGVTMALYSFIVYGLFLFYAQYYVEELDETYHHLLTHSADLERLNQEVTAMAYRDSLTGLPNEVSFIRHLEQAKDHLTVMMINVRNFASFNQILGFNQGNELLKKMAEQLMPFASVDHSIFKLYNDKFLIVTRQMDTHEVLAFVKQIQEAFAQEAVMNFRLDIGVGITQLETRSVDADVANTLIGALEVANAKAKVTEKGVFFLSMDQYLSEKVQYNLEYHLRQAIENRHIEVYYQPQVHAKTKQVHSYEALARWRMNGEFVSPGVFVPLAESAGLISKLSYQVIENVFSDMDRLRWNRGRKISINLSSIQLVASDFLTSLHELLGRYAINPKEIVFEITETALLYDLKKVEETIRTIKALGFEISLDDFGTGYSSLNRFAKLNFDEVKFDRFFIKDLKNDEKLMLVFAKTVELFNQFDMRIVVEGVETAEQEAILDGFDIDCYQGYYYSKPVPIGELFGK